MALSAKDIFYKGHRAGNSAVNNVSSKTTSNIQPSKPAYADLRTPPTTPRPVVTEQRSGAPNTSSTISSSKGFTNSAAKSTDKHASKPANGLPTKAAPLSYKQLLKLGAKVDTEKLKIVNVEKKKEFERQDAKKAEAMRQRHAIMMAKPSTIAKFTPITKSTPITLKSPHAPPERIHNSPKTVVRHEPVINRASQSKSYSPLKKTNHAAPIRSKSASSLRNGPPPGELIKLGTVKRDLRRIDQIQADLAARKGLNGGSAAKKPGLKATTSIFDGPSIVARSVSVSRSKSTSTLKQQREETESSSTKRQPVMSDSKSSRPTSQKRQRDISDDDTPVPKRSRRSELSKQIWEAMGLNRDKYYSRDVDSDDDDMEASGMDVLREEARSAKIARKEDEEEEARLKAAEEAKERKRQMKMRQGH